MRLETEAKQIDQLNHILGTYVAYAINNPKKYPKNPSLVENKKIEHKPEDFRKIAKQRYGKK